jgi:hypothetical protein
MNKHLWYVWRNRFFTLFTVLCFLLAPMLPGCGVGKGGGDGTGSAEEGTGEVGISLTDAPSDFSSYTVDVVSISLKKLNGAEVETLPLTQRVDFSQYTDMSEFVTACTIPSGVYTKVTLTLDYSNADIRVEDNTGKIQQISQGNITILDDEDNIVTSRTRVRVSVNLGTPALTIVPGAATHLALDFNLKATNSVDLSGSAPVLTVSPMLLAELEPQDKTHRVRGMLAVVQQDRNLFDVVVMPFIHRLSGSQAHFGTLRVLTDDDTVYVIDNTQYQGSSGLAELAMPANANASILVLGEFKAHPNRLEAQEVYVGSSVPGSGADIVNGNVVARSGDTLTITGASLVRSSGDLRFCKTVTVTLDETTKVSRQFSKDTFSKDDISVGQRIVVFGDNASFNESTGRLLITASAARMFITHLRGTVKSISSGVMVVNLSAIDGRKPGVFDFSGTGADPANYEIGTSGLTLSNIKKDTRVKVWGFVNVFGSIPPDFKAQTVINISTVYGLIHVNWNPADYKAFSEKSDQRLVLNFNENLGRYHFLFRAGMVDDLVTGFGGQPVVIKAPDSGTPFFCIAQGLYFRPYTDFSEFSGALNDFILNGGDVRYITAIGLFNDDIATMNASYLVVRFPLL